MLFKFGFYKLILSFFVYLSFRSQKVLPLEAPTDEKVMFLPYSSMELTPSANIDYLLETIYPEKTKDASRLKRIRLSKRIANALSSLKLMTPPISKDYRQFIKSVYPCYFMKAWPDYPKIPPEISQSQDLLASLAVAGPMADYIKRVNREEALKINELLGEMMSEDEIYLIDLSRFEKYPVKADLCQLGGIIIFDLTERDLKTRAIIYKNEIISQNDPRWFKTEKIALCTLATHLEIIRHNIFIHLLYTNTIAIMTINHLPSNHPIRRLLHPCFQTLLIGNREVSLLQIRGNRSFCSKKFSFEYETMIDVINEHVRNFDVRQFDPMRDVEMRQVQNPQFDYPFLENIKPLWEVTFQYVNDYVDHYFTEQGIKSDAALESWYQSLEQYLPNGLSHYVPQFNQEAVKKLCASFIYTSTVTHDNINNIVWNYTTLGQYIPKMVPIADHLEKTEVSFDNILTLIGTWKPFNMLLDGFSDIALDEGGKKIMDDFVNNLQSIQHDLEKKPFKYHTIYPKNLNFSISN